MTTTVPHNSTTCNLNASQPYDICAWVNENEADQIVTSSFADDWRLAPRSMTNYVESTVAKYWYEIDAGKCRLAATVTRSTVQKGIQMSSEATARP